MVVYRYPVYDLNIPNYQFDIIELGNTHEIDSQNLAYIESNKLALATTETIAYLFDIEKWAKSHFQRKCSMSEYIFNVSAIVSDKPSIDLRISVTLETR
ncbi:hypothetical protein L3V77_10005 [Vibrio sp. DW001]|uniref:hypothetical protein n=1 Tax=Vibrio sp. DW001 TaxID=2912315 RepID=UPI0023B14162|nr:hypothetical protein [Vibrio sp. DW001]WED25404.1 hypothetical protein L3V77_10005 [Vibrio sp. DW001]